MEVEQIHLVGEDWRARQRVSRHAVTTGHGFEGHGRRFIEHGDSLLLFGFHSPVEQLL